MAAALSAHAQRIRDAARGTDQRVRVIFFGSTAKVQAGHITEAGPHIADAVRELEAGGFLILESGDPTATLTYIVA
ncbi:MAG TPA: hypothetical protein VKT83_17975 [bacterium]|nr:hypothetical protein [bacterium]